MDTCVSIARHRGGPVTKVWQCFILEMFVLMTEVPKKHVRGTRYNYGSWVLFVLHRFEG